MHALILHHAGGQQRIQAARDQCRGLALFSQGQFDWEKRDFIRIDLGTGCIIAGF